MDQGATPSGNEVRSVSVNAGEATIIVDGRYKGYEKTEEDRVKVDDWATDDDEENDSRKDQLEELTNDTDCEREEIEEKENESSQREQDKDFFVKQGCGMCLKDIPNVADKLLSKKPTELRLLHYVIFGAVCEEVSDFKNRILHFSGLVGNEDEEDERMLVKEKLEKCKKESLQLFCDLFNIRVSAVLTKGELITTVLDFLEEPRVVDEVIKSKSLKGSNCKSTKATCASKNKRRAHLKPKKPRPKKRKSSEAKLSSLPGDCINEEVNCGDSEKAIPLYEGTQTTQVEEYVEFSNKQESNKLTVTISSEETQESSQNPNGIGPAVNLIKTDLGICKTNAPLLKLEIDNSNLHPPKQSNVDLNSHSSIKSSKKRKLCSARSNKEAAKSNKTPHVESTTGGTTSSGQKIRGPNKEALRKAICIVLDDTNYCTATFRDVMGELDKYFGMDLSHRRNTIKNMIEEELMKRVEDEDE